MKKQWTSELTVDAGNPAVRIEVIDSNFEIRARGYNRIQETLPTGIYKVRYQAGDAVVEKLIKIEPNRPVSLLDPPRLEYGSAAPIEQTSTSREYHQAHAHQLSHTTQLKHGEGSELFLFVRDLEPGARSHPMRGMSLHALDGTQLVDLEKESQRSTGSKEASWAGCTVALAPGSYRLRLAVRKGPPVETMIVACPKWQSQVFLLRMNTRSEPNRFEPLDLSAATQLMARPNKGFDPYLSDKRFSLRSASADMRLADLARQAVANQWRGFHAKDLNELLRGKFFDPLLGILGLHLLLMRPEPDLKSAARIHRRLQQNVLAGFPHPDVEALGIEIERLQGKTIVHEPIASPPILRRSWSLLLKASTQLPSLIPGGSFSSMIADRLWGNDAWLCWRVPEFKPEDWNLEPEKPTDKPRAMVPTRTKSLRDVTRPDLFEVQVSLRSFLPRLEELIAQYKDVDKLAKKAALDPDERKLLNYLALTLQLHPVTSSPSRDLFSLDALVPSLGLPADRIQIMTVGLLDKLSPLVKQKR